MTDIIGSTRFVQRYGAVKSSLWFSKNDKLIMSLIYQNNGTFIDASDGTLCYFDTISDAISFSFSYKRSLVKYKFPFRARLGIHWDEMISKKTKMKRIWPQIQRACSCRWRRPGQIARPQASFWRREVPHAVFVPLLCPLKAAHPWRLFVPPIAPDAF